MSERTDIDTGEFGDFWRLHPTQFYQFQYRDYFQKTCLHRIHDTPSPVDGEDPVGLAQDPFGGSTIEQTTDSDRPPWQPSEGGIYTATGHLTALFDSVDPPWTIAFRVKNDDPTDSRDTVFSQGTDFAIYRDGETISLSINGSGTAGMAWPYEDQMTWTTVALVAESSASVRLWFDDGVNSETGLSLATLTSGDIGCRASGVRQWNGWIRWGAFFGNRALTNAQLGSL